ncbi:MAG: CRISPR-associated protein Cas4 [Anaerolineales bacterium]|nr:CRISPR-associated protein Cas4 [Anaerolineales bacterium]
MAPTALILIFLALLLLWQARRVRKASGIPAGQVIYVDTRAWGPVEKSLYDPEYGLTGKPDYLVEQDSQVIPVEVKSSRVGQAPYDSHIFQLAAYCRLVHASYKQRPAYGILHYPNRTYRIDYTPELESQLANLLIEIRNDERKKELPRSHNSPRRCQRCGYQTTCDQRLR